MATGRGSSKRQEHRTDYAKVRSVRAHPPAPPRRRQRDYIERFLKTPGRPPLVIKWREPLGHPECPYVYRWRIDARDIGSIRIHHWIASDDPRAWHDHPWWFLTFILKGGYTDRTPDGDEHLHAGNIRYRPALHQHTVVPDKNGCWTLLITGPNRRTWGFWQNGKFRKARRWFASQGHHPCA